MEAAKFQIKNVQPTLDLTSTLGSQQDEVLQQDNKMGQTAWEITKAEYGVKQLTIWWNANNRTELRKKVMDTRERQKRISAATGAHDISFLSQSRINDTRLCEAILPPTTGLRRRRPGSRST